MTVRAIQAIDLCALSLDELRLVEALLETAVRLAARMPPGATVRMEIAAGQARIGVELGEDQAFELVEPEVAAAPPPAQVPPAPPPALEVVASVVPDMVDAVPVAPPAPSVAPVPPPVAPPVAVTVPPAAVSPDDGPADPRIPSQRRLFFDQVEASRDDLTQLDLEEQRWPPEEIAAIIDRDARAQLVRRKVLLMGGTIPRRLVLGWLRDYLNPPEVG